ncbi:hypothetical protein ACFWWT_49020 [Streptomyces sp. NPDC058676]|uniref:hypothetical protein n=1 Tax=unclassified Streptomyces TaxID=2593676 RepID=UPI00364EA791
MRVPGEFHVPASGVGLVTAGLVSGPPALSCAGEARPAPEPAGHASAVGYNMDAGAG